MVVQARTRMAATVTHECKRVFCFWLVLIFKTVQINFEDEEYFESNSRDDEMFDTVVGELEEMLIDNKFVSLQESFFSKYCESFTDDEENKLLYTEVFQNYTQTIEKFIESRLKNRLPCFSMAEFMKAV
ncbi:ADP-ribosylation factor-like protein 2-binding protein, partial [Nowakowskiella sp. JEL0078]